jgi:alanine dehydrogenase
MIELHNRHKGRMRMIIGVPKEIKSEENRVAIVPGGLETLTARGHGVIIEQGAGSGSGFSDADYERAGASIAATHDEVFLRSELVLKVKEPLPVEYPLLRQKQVLFTYLHLAASEALTRALSERGIIGIAYETVQTEDGYLPLLAPMSEIAGRMAVQEGAKYLEKTYGGRGVLLGGIPGVPPANVVVLGAGNVGYNAARVAIGMGASVTVLDVNPRKLRAIDEAFQGRLITMIADNYNIRVAIAYADLTIGAVLVPGGRAPKLITREMLRIMRPGSVIVDVAIDQGGSVETSRPTTHHDPVYIEEGIVHYAVTNMPGAVPRTATRALTVNTIPYVIALTDKGWRKAAAEDISLARGVNLVEGMITHKGVAEAFGLPHTPIEELL